MAKEVGCIEIGKKADIVVIGMDSPCIVGTTNLRAALVMHASPSDVECVIVNGEVVREDRKLLKVEWEKF